MKKRTTTQKAAALDLRSDAETIADYVRRRVKDYPVYINAGPGDDDDKVTQITLGYSFDQSGWISLVFDTRSVSQCDGEWQAFIEDTCLELPHWTAAIETMYEANRKLAVTLADGSKKTLAAGAEPEAIAALFGKMLQGIMTDACQENLFSKLPLAKQCLLAVEEHEGNWGWLGTFDGKRLKTAKPGTQGSDGPDPKAPKLSVAEQIEFWVDLIDRLAAGETCRVTPPSGRPRTVKPDLDGEQFSIYEAEKLGKVMAVPFLQLACKWADKPEWPGKKEWHPDRQHSGNALPHAGIVTTLLYRFGELGVANAEIEKLLQEILRKSLQANAGRKRMWGETPHKACFELHDLSKKYPRPDYDYETNIVANASVFLSKAATTQTKRSAVKRR